MSTSTAAAAIIIKSCAYCDVYLNVNNNDEKCMVFHEYASCLKCWGLLSNDNNYKEKVETTKAPRSVRIISGEEDPAMLFPCIGNPRSNDPEVYDFGTAFMHSPDAFVSRQKRKTD
jgi:hypothetical protein